MLTTILLVIKFLLKSTEEGHDVEYGLEHISKKKIIQAMLFGCGNVAPLPILLVIIYCLIATYVSAKFANKCEIKKLNKVIGICLY